MPDRRGSFEHEFLIRLAPTWLACRWKVMGHELSGWKAAPKKPDLANDLLGMVDYATEMKLICRAKLNGK
jgi:hypothetical protein